MFTHGITFGGHPVAVRDRAQEHRDHEARARSSSTCASTQARFRGDARAAARAADRRRRARHRLLLRARARQGQGDARRLHDGGVASGCCAASSRRELFERGLICRADDRGDPVVQISPPLVAGAGRVRRDRPGSSATCSRRPRTGSTACAGHPRRTCARAPRRRAARAARPPRRLRSPRGRR